MSSPLTKISVVILDVLIAIPMIALYLKVRAREKLKKERYEDQAQDELNAIYQGLRSKIEDYKFYTTGHPYVWVETSREEMQSEIKKTCIRGTGKGIVYLPALYVTKVNEDLKCIYYVPYVKEFDFSRLMHYQEWLESQKDVAERIAEHKNS